MAPLEKIFLTSMVERVFGSVYLNVVRNLMD